MATLVLLNGNGLADAMGRGRNYVTAMRRAGYQFQYPGRTTLRHALAWLENRPHFVADHYLRTGWERLPKCQAEPANQPA